MAKRKNVEPTVAAAIDSVEGFTLTPEEMEAIKALRQRKVDTTAEPKVGIGELAQALVTAIESTRPPTKKNPFNRKKGDPWQPKPGQIKPKLKRAWHQHGGELDPKNLYVEEVELLNKVKPGNYVHGLVQIFKNKDRSYNITWPVKTAAQRLRVLNEAGGTFALILQRCIDEYADPKKFRGPEDEDDD